ncbi:hypothetical protein CL617_04030 [archaeon]|nr:hypothetical protein [archaeon]|tara:strand:- start:7008 stop:7382 length:375 start_codon:yes stop_codon:yes gene_type:complete
MRFYNLKVENPESHGVALKVDNTQNIESKLKDMTKCYKVEIHSHIQGFSTYEISNNKNTIAHLRINLEEELYIKQNIMGKELFLTEITEEGANKQAEGAANWRLLQGYVGPDLPTKSKLEPHFY